MLLPVGADHVIPSRWVTAIHRDWNARYVWPRFVTAVPREFFAAVREDAAARGLWLVPQTRDMNPVYPGKDVSYIDTKQGQRAAEIAVGEGERLATLAWLAGAATRRSRWTRRGASSSSARITTRSPGPSPTRSTWTCWAGGGRPGSAVTRRAAMRRPTWPAWPTPGARS